LRLVTHQKERGKILTSLQQLEQNTNDQQDEIYSGPNATEKTDQIFKTTLKLLGSALSGNKSSLEIKDDVNAGLGVFLNIAKNTRWHQDPLGPAMLDAIESTLVGFGKKILAEDRIQDGSVTTVELANGMVGVQLEGEEDSDRDSYYPSNHTVAATYIHVPKEWSDTFRGAQVMYIAARVPGESFGGEIFSDHSITGGDKERVLNSNVISFTFFDSTEKSKHFEFTSTFSTKNLTTNFLR